MDKLWDRIKGAMEKSKGKFQEYTDKAKEKTEKSKKVVRLRIRKTKLEHKIYKNLAKMGSEVYESIKKGKKSLTDIPNIDHLLNDTKKLDEKLMHIMSILDDLSKS